MAFVHHTGDETKFVMHTMENSQVYNHLSIDFISYQKKKALILFTWRVIYGFSFFSFSLSTHISPF